MARKKIDTEETPVEEVVEEIAVTEEVPEEIAEKTIGKVAEEAVDEVAEETLEEIPEETKPAAKTVKAKAAKQAKAASAATTSTATASAAPAKKYSSEDLIPCRSITQGRLLMTGPRSKLPYTWYNLGDVIYVEYQDLTALMLTKSKYLTAPYFVIEDEEMLQDPFWASIAKLYESMANVGDIETIINLPPQQLKRALNTLPKPFQKTLAIEVSTRIENGTYDSINRIKIFDEVCGTDLMCLIS